MTENQNAEKRITYSLMAVVVAFVLLMSCIVLWITSSLIRSERGGINESPPAIIIASPSYQTTSTSPLQATARVTAAASVTQTAHPNGPILLEATWTPILGDGKYVRFNYWYVKPNKIEIGGCIRLTWVTENAVSLQLYRNGMLILEDAPPSGILQDCPQKPGYAVYRMVATSPTDESNWIQLQVKVVEAR